MKESKFFFRTDKTRVEAHNDGIFQQRGMDFNNYSIKHTHLKSIIGAAGSGGGGSRVKGGGGEGRRGGVYKFIKQMVKCFRASRHYLRNKSKLTCSITKSMTIVQNYCPSFLSPRTSS